MSNELDGQNFALSILVYKEQSMHAAVMDYNFNYSGRDGGACKRYSGLAWELSIPAMKCDWCLSDYQPWLQYALQYSR